MSPVDLFERVLTSLHEATLNDANWPATAGLIDELIGTRANTLVVGKGRTQAESDLFFVCHCFGGERHEDWEHRYFRDYWLRDESIPRIATLADSRLVHTMDLYSDREKKTSMAYESRRAAGMQNGLNVRMDGPDGSNVVWILGNSTHREGWNSAQIETIERLLPCVRRFAHGRQLLADAGALGKSITQLLDNIRFGVIQLDRYGRIVAANDSARRLLMQGDALVDSRGILRAVRPAEDAGFQRLLAKALPPFGLRSSAGSTTLGRSGAWTRLLVHIMPVMDRESAFRTSRVAALVLVADPERKARIDPGLVGAAMGLTPAESRLAVMLATGRTPQDIAAVTNRTKGTVRWHLKRIFSKQGISRQSELVRRVLSLDGFPGPGRRGARASRRLRHLVPGRTHPPNSGGAVPQLVLDSEHTGKTVPARTDREAARRHRASGSTEKQEESTCEIGTRPCPRQRSSRA